MTQVPAPVKKPTIPNLTTLLDALKNEIFHQMNCVKVGVIQSFDAALQEAVIQIAYTQVTSVSPEGVKTLAQYPLLLNVPVLFPAGGGYTLTFPIAAGDECILLFNDQQIDNWVTQGAGLPPSTPRAHDLSDAIAIVGLRNNTRALGGVSTSTAQLRNDAGNTYVEVAGGGIVNVTAPTQINLNSPIVRVAGVIEVINENSVTTSCSITGNISLNGTMVASGDVTAAGISLESHRHTGVTTGGGDTGGPI